MTFDDEDPPDRALADACVHCGFCLPSCPTYALWGEEMDSPRGRIYLMKSGLDNRTAMTAPFVGHFDACLGCMACVTACPSGVQYGPLVEATRGQIERRYRRTLSDRAFRAAIFFVFPYPRRLRLALLPLAIKDVVVGMIERKRRSSFDVRRASFEVRRSTRGVRGSHDEPRTTHDERGTKHDERSTTNVSLWRRLEAMFALSPRLSLRSLFTTLPERAPAIGARRTTVGLLTGCVQSVLFPQVNRATMDVLAAEGCDVVAPSGQGCCGALALHAGRLEDARAFARRTIETFDRPGIERIAVNAAGCGSSMKEYGHLLADDSKWAARARAFSLRVKDVTEIVTSLTPARAARHPMRLRVGYHDACHLAHAQGVRQPPRDLLQSIPELELVPLAEPEMCCGSAGIYNLVEPEAARQLGDRKAAHLAAARPDVVASANPGCTLQIAAAFARRGDRVPIVHPIELLHASITGALRDPG